MPLDWVNQKEDHHAKESRFLTVRAGGAVQLVHVYPTRVAMQPTGIRGHEQSSIDLPA